MLLHPAQCLSGAPSRFSLRLFVALNESTRYDVYIGGKMIWTARSDEFFEIFTNDLMPHQDDVTTAAELVAGARAVVAWYAANDPESNVVDAADAADMLAWFDLNVDLLVNVAQYRFDDNA